MVLTGSPLANWWGYNDGLEALEFEAGPMLREVGDRLGKPVIMNADQLHFPAVQNAIAAGVPTYRDIDSVAFVLLRLADAFEHPPEGLPILPEPAEPVVEASAQEAARRLLVDAGLTLVDKSVPAGSGIEIFIGCRQLRSFGPVVFAGMGGLCKEVLPDLRCALAPIDEAAAERLLCGVPGAQLLYGSKGRAAVDIAAAAQALAALSRVAARHPEIAEIAIDPLLVTPIGAVGFGVRVILKSEMKEAADEPRR